MNKLALPLPRARLGVPHTPAAGLTLLIFMTTWSLSPKPHSPRFHSGSLLLAIALGIYLCVASSIGAAKLGEAGRVLFEMKTPGALWQAWQRSFLRSQVLTWAIASIAGATVLVVSDTVASACAAVMLYSLIMAGTTVLPLAQRGLLPRKWGIVIPLLLTAYLGFCGPRSYDVLVELPLFVKLPLSTLWFLLIAYLQYRWKINPPRQAAAFYLPRQSAWRRIHAWYLRFTILSSNPQTKQSRYGAFLILPYIFAVEASGFWSNHAWGGDIGPAHLLTLLLILTYAGYFLYCRDLHWRHLLAPGGIAKGRMGWHLVRSTLTVYASVLFPALLAYAILAWLIRGISPIAALENVLRFSSILCEAVFVICVATALRGTKYWWLTTIALYGIIALAVLATALALRLDGRALMGTWFHVGPAYLAMLAAGSLASILAANRLWTTKRLLPLVVQGIREAEMPEARWQQRVGLSRRN